FRQTLAAQPRADSGDCSVSCPRPRHRARRVAQVNDRAVEPRRAAGSAPPRLARRRTIRAPAGGPGPTGARRCRNSPGARRVACCGRELSRSRRALTLRPRPLDYGTDAFGIRENIELLDPDADPFDAPIGKAGSANPFRETLAQIDMSGAGDIADSGDNFFVIDDAPTVLSGEGVGC